MSILQIFLSTYNVQEINFNYTLTYFISPRDRDYHCVLYIITYILRSTAEIGVVFGETNFRITYIKGKGTIVPLSDA